MPFDEIPFMSCLADAQRVLIAGAGGGFDVFGGLPLYFRLRELGKEVFLGNLSFTNLGEVEGVRLVPNMVAVTARSTGPKHYFPERHLATWFDDRGEAMTIHAFEKTGHEALLAAYRALLEQTRCDAVVLVDGGTDILMRGDEAGLGTPQEDISSLAAVDNLDVPVKLVVCVGPEHRGHVGRERHRR